VELIELCVIKKKIDAMYKPKLSDEKDLMNIRGLNENKKNENDKLFLSYLFK
jgi:hypothetical protein